MYAQKTHTDTHIPKSVDVAVLFFRFLTLTKKTMSSFVVRGAGHST